MYGCDTYLHSPSFAPPIYPIDSSNVIIIDAFTIRLLWDYDLDNNTEIKGFNIYHTSFNDFKDNVSYGDFSNTPLTYFEIDQLSIDPDSQLYFKDIESLEYNKWHYFYSSAVVGDYESLENFITEGKKLVIDAPDINFSDVNPEYCWQNGYDGDCKILITNPSGSIYTGSSFFILKNSSDSGLIVDTLNYLSDPDTTLLGLKLCSEEIDDWRYCNFIPNTDYTILYYFEQINKDNGEKRRSDSTSHEIFFERSVELMKKKALTSNSCRLYFDDRLLENYYDNISVYDQNDNLLQIQNIGTFEQVGTEVIMDISGVENGDSVSYVILGTNSFIFSNEEMITLPSELNGYRLLELETPPSNNLYMSVYEITTDYSSDFTSGISAGSDPLEVNYADAIDFIEDLNSFFSNYTNYTFRLPTKEEWSATCGWDYSQGVSYNYPWGQEVESHNANYLNSQFPEGSNGITAVGFHPYPNANGIYDLSGNVMEWMESGEPEDSALARGGAYYSSPEFLRCSQDFNVPVTESTGMGFHLILEVYE